MSVTSKQQKAIAALLTSPTIEAAADVVGVTDRTIYRWLNEVDFQNELHKAQNQAIDAAISRLAGGAAPVANIMVTITEDETQPGSTRVAAGRTVLTMIERLMEFRKLEQRIADLEARLNVGN